MSRSVSTPTETVAVCYRDISDVDGEFEFEEQILNWIRERAQELWTSLDTCDTWLGREDHAILENGHCYIGVSEYCGLASIWLVSKSDDHLNSDDAAIANLSDHWCNQIASRFESTFGQYSKIGTASNGESFYHKVN